MSGVRLHYYPRSLQREKKGKLTLSVILTDNEYLTDGKGKVRDPNSLHCPDLILRICT